MKLSYLSEKIVGSLIIYLKGEGKDILCLQIDFEFWKLHRNIHVIFLTAVRFVTALF